MALYHYWQCAHLLDLFASESLLKNSNCNRAKINCISSRVFYTSSCICPSAYSAASYFNMAVTSMSSLQDYQVYSLHMAFPFHIETPTTRKAWNCGHAMLIIHKWLLYTPTKAAHMPLENLCCLFLYAKGGILMDAESKCHKNKSRHFSHGSHIYVITASVTGPGVLSECIPPQGISFPLHIEYIYIQQGRPGTAATLRASYCYMHNTIITL